MIKQETGSAVVELDKDLDSFANIDTDVEEDVEEDELLSMTSRL